MPPYLLVPVGLPKMADPLEGNQLISSDCLLQGMSSAASAGPAIASAAAPGTPSNKGASSKKKSPGKSRSEQKKAALESARKQKQDALKKDDLDALLSAEKEAAELEKGNSTARYNDWARKLFVGDDCVLVRHHKLLDAITFKPHGAARAKYLIPQADGTVKEVTNQKQLYGHKKNGEHVSGIIADHSYNTQRLRSFIHLIIRQHAPVEFAKIVDGSFTRDPTPDKAIKYAEKLVSARIADAKQAFNEYVKPLIPEGQEIILISEQQSSEIYARINNLDSVKRLPLTSDDKLKVGKWISDGQLLKSKTADDTESGDEETSADKMVSELFDNHLTLLGLDLDKYNAKSMTEKQWEDIKTAAAAREDYEGRREAKIEQLLELATRDFVAGHQLKKVAKEILKMDDEFRSRFSRNKKRPREESASSMSNDMAEEAEDE
jgi:hypothetical protein